MRHSILFLLAVACLLPLQAEEAPFSLGGSLGFNAELSGGEDLSFSGNQFFSDTTELGMHLEFYPQEGLRLFVEGAVNAENLLEADGLEDLAEAGDAITFGLAEAYVAYSGFLAGSLDLKAGRQRLPWGRGEEVSVLDILDSPDYSLPLKQGKRLASDALRLDLYLNNAALQFIWIPAFNPAVIPSDQSIFGSSIPSGMTTSLGSPDSTIADQTSLGFKGGLSLSGWDLSAYYAWTRERLPAVSETVVTGLNAGNVSLAFPRVHVAGVDLIGELFGLGLWGEIAAFFPDYEAVTDMTAIGGGVTSKEASPYAKWLIGGDYTFPGGLYLNLQYAHGLYHESSASALGDYIFLGIEWTLADGRIKIGPLGAGFELRGGEDILSGDKDFADSWGLSLNPELHFYPKDGFDLFAGLRWFSGADGTTFGNYSALSGAFAGLKVSF